ncbi:MAG: CocE/NonD family hydrolase [Coriobacteriales bacterium]
MLFGREQFTVPTEMNGETIEKVYAKELKPTPIEEFEKLPEDEKKLCKPYTFNQRTYEAAPGIICEQDVAVPMRDGVKLYADIFRPSDTDEKVPAILAWSNYGKRCNEFRTGDDIAYTPGVPAGTVSEMAKFEGPDPAYWCHYGYAVINVDIRGIGYSEGYHEQFGKQDAEDGFDFIEWTAKQPWCNGKVTMAGTSALAISQWHIAAEQPHHLACIAPWEGMTDMYRESLCEGGIPCVKFTNFATAGACGLNGIDDQGAMAEKYPLMNAYWEDKIPDFSKVQVPAYVCAGWNHFHLRGTVMGWRLIGSKDKWLRTHRDFEWPDFYTGKNMDELRKFFDRYCKGIHNGWELTPRVRIAVQDKFDEDWCEARPEDEFPLARTRYEKLYLNASGMSMSASPVSTESEARYDGETGELDFDYKFEEDTEITGYPKLHLWVAAADYDDMDLFITVKKLSPEGVEQPITIFNGTAPHPGAWGKMRVSHRELDPEQSTDFQPIQSHRRLLKLEPGEIVPVDIEINPVSRIWHAGETLRVQIAGRYIRDPHWIEPLMWETDNHGDHIIYTGGEHDSFLQIPVIPPKHDPSEEFVVDESKHPKHPIF